VKHKAIANTGKWLKKINGNRHHSKPLLMLLVPLLVIGFLQLFSLGYLLGLWLRRD